MLSEARCARIDVPYFMRIDLIEYTLCKKVLPEEDF
jgi:hypothetical protein